jgi:hypothetical protein
MSGASTLRVRPARRLEKAGASDRVLRCRRKFLRVFPKGFYDAKYIDWERGYKWEAHERWKADLGPAEFRRLLGREAFGEIAMRALRIESRTNLLFSFEKMAIRDAVGDRRGARAFAVGLFDYVYGDGGPRAAFERWAGTVAALPRKKTRVLTWPVVTVFGFIARPDKHMFLKPNVSRNAASAYGFPFEYRPGPAWETYESLLDFAATVRRDLRDLRPRDLMDIQSFIWVQGSEEY